MSEKCECLKHDQQRERFTIKIKKEKEALQRTIEMGAISVRPQTQQPPKAGCGLSSSNERRVNWTQSIPNTH